MNHLQGEDKLEQRQLVLGGSQGGIRGERERHRVRDPRAAGEAGDEAAQEARQHEGIECVVRSARFHSP